MCAHLLLVAPQTSFFCDVFAGDAFGVGFAVAEAADALGAPSIKKRTLAVNTTSANVGIARFTFANLPGIWLSRPVRAYLFLPRTSRRHDCFN
jgi:hypothetical protein